jgi:hypothetical protein
VIEELKRYDLSHWDSGVLGALQRRMRLWRVQFGAEREVYSAQEHSLGQQGLPEFTVADALKVEIDGSCSPTACYGPSWTGCELESG